MGPREEPPADAIQAPGSGGAPACGPEEPPPTSRGGRFAPESTLAFALLWLAVVFYGWSPLVDHDPTVWLRYPESSAERLAARDLELSEGLEEAPAPLRPLLADLYGSRDEALDAAIDVHRDVIDALDSQDVAARASVLRLALLLADAGEGDEALEALEDDDDPGMRELFAAALEHRIDPAQEEAILDRFAAAGLSQEYLDLATRWIANAAGDSARADAAGARIRARGRRVASRSLWLLASNALLVALGAGLAILRVPRLRELLGARTTPPWSFADGIGVFVRGDFWNRLYFVLVMWLFDQPWGARLTETPAGELLQTWGSLLACLPLLWLVHRHLLAPRRAGAVRVFGLRPGWRGAGAILGISLTAIAVDLAGTQALGWATWGLGVSSSWSEGFDEVLVWGTSVQAFLTSMDYVLWAPASEELAFRGILYFSLRHRLPPVAAAAVTAGLFAALHFYSLPGFLMTLWSGFVWALAFEAARSLLPGIAAHAVYNGLYIAGMILLYR